MTEAELEPSNEEMMDPESPHFTLDWWQICEILPPDPWAYIVSDFHWSRSLLIQAKMKSLQFETTDIGHYPKSSGTNDQISFALNAAMSLYEDIENQISVKCVALETIWSWGEYQKSIAILQTLLPTIKREEGMIAHSKAQAEIKNKAREWFVLWFDWYIANKVTSVRKTRPTFEDFFIKLAKQIRFNQRQIPEKWGPLVLDLVDAMILPADENHGFKLTGFYTDSKFYGEKLRSTRLSALEHIDDLPPVGEDFYRLK